MPGVRYAYAGERTIPARTVAAYRNTKYWVGGIEVRIGRRSRPMDGLLASYGVRQAVFITAYNPFSRVMPSGWNLRMQAALMRTLRRYRILIASGSWRRWSESHVVVLGDPRPALRLMRLFRQNGIVIVRVRQNARLVIPYDRLGRTDT
jgi:hypothetical protein